MKQPSKPKIGRAKPVATKKAPPRARVPKAQPQPLDPPAVEARPKVSLDPGRRREVVAILSVGCSRTTAAQYVGCHASTITRTARRDPEFARQLRQAESMLEIKHLRNIDAAAKDTRYWRAAAWALERKYPERWGQRRPHALSAEQVGEALAQFAQLVVEEVTEAKTRTRILKRLDKLAAALAKKDEANQR